MPALTANLEKSFIRRSSDNLGTVRDLAEYDDATDETTIVDHYVYDAFGNETDHTGSNDFLFKYTGRAFDDETGLQNNLNRWFDPTVGRWLSEDPIGFAAGDANVYRYVGNFATGATDPSGLQTKINSKDFWAGAKIIAKAQGLPTWMLDVAAKAGTKLAEGDIYWYDRATGTIYIRDPDTTGKKCQRVGKAGRITDQRLDLQADLTALYEEVFHMIFQHYVENKQSHAGWLRDIIAMQGYTSEKTEKAEEAMSSIISQALKSIQEGKRLPSYQEILKMPANSAWRKAITPYHPESKREYLKTDDAKKPVNEELFYATLAFLRHHLSSWDPDKDPLGRLPRLRGFVERCFPISRGADGQSN